MIEHERVNLAEASLEELRKIREVVLGQFGMDHVEILIVIERCVQKIKFGLTHIGKDEIYRDMYGRDSTIPEHLRYVQLIDLPDSEIGYRRVSGFDKKEDEVVTDLLTPKPEIVTADLVNDTGTPATEPLVKKQAGTNS